MTLDTHLLGLSDQPQEWAHPSKKLPNGSGGREAGEGAGWAGLDQGLSRGPSNSRGRAWQAPLPGRLSSVPSQGTGLGVSRRT